MYKKTLKALRKDEENPHVELDGQEGSSETPTVTTPPESTPKNNEIDGHAELSNRYYNLNDIREHVSSGKLAPDVRRGEERKFIGNVHIHVDGKNYHVSSLDDAGLELSHNQFKQKVDPQGFDSHIHNQLKEVLNFNPPSEDFPDDTRDLSEASIKLNDFIYDNHKYLNESHVQAILDHMKLDDPQDEGEHHMRTSEKETQHQAIKQLANKAKLTSNQIDTILEGFGYSETSNRRVQQSLSYNKNIQPSDIIRLHQQDSVSNHHFIVNYLSNNKGNFDLSDNDVKTLWDNKSVDYSQESADYSQESADDTRERAVEIKTALLNHYEDIPEDILNNIAQGKDPHLLPSILRQISNTLSSTTFKHIIDNSEFIDKSSKYNHEKIVDSILEHSDFQKGNELFDTFFDKAPDKWIGRALYTDSLSIDEGVSDKILDRVAKTGNPEIMSEMATHSSLENSLNLHPEKTAANIIKALQQVKAIGNDIPDQSQDVNSVFAKFFENTSLPPQAKQYVVENMSDKQLSKSLSWMSGEEITQLMPFETIRNIMHSSNKEKQGSRRQLIDIFWRNKDLISDENLHEMTKADNLSDVITAYKALGSRDYSRDYNRDTISRNSVHYYNFENSKILRPEAAHQLIANIHTDKDSYSEINQSDISMLMKASVLSLGEDEVHEMLGKGIVDDHNAFRLVDHLEKPETIQSIYNRTTGDKYLESAVQAYQTFNRFIDNENTPKYILEDMFKNNHNVPSRLKAKVLGKIDISSEDLEKMLETSQRVLETAIVQHPNLHIETAMNHVNGIIGRHDVPDMYDYYFSEPYDEKIHTEYEDENDYDNNAESEFDSEGYDSALEYYTDQFEEYDDIVNSISERSDLTRDHIENIVDEYVTNYSGGYNDRIAEPIEALGKHNNGLLSLMEHPNFSTRAAELLRDSSFDDEYKHEEIHEALQQNASFEDVDEYNQNTESPETLKGTPFSKPLLKVVHIHPHIDELKMLKHYLADMKAPKKGFNKGMLKDFTGVLSKVPEIMDSQGRTSMERLDKIIEDKEKIAMPVNMSFTTWGDGGSESNYDGMQRHDDEYSQLVIRVNLTGDMIHRMKAEGVYGTFQQIHKASYASDHPVKGNTIGWARVDNQEEGHWHIDELQSDFGSDLSKKISAELREYKEQNGAAKAKEAEAMSDQFLKEHESNYRKVQEIINGAHDDSNHLIQSAVIQLARQQKDEEGENSIKTMSFDTPDDQHNQSSLGGKNRPVHFINTYQKRPKRLKFKEANKGKAFPSRYKDGVSDRKVQLAPLYKSKYWKKYSVLFKSTGSISLPGLKDIPTRLDQQIRPIETARQSDIGVKQVAEKARRSNPENKKAAYNEVKPHMENFVLHPSKHPQQSIKTDIPNKSTSMKELKIKIRASKNNQQERDINQTQGAAGFIVNTPDSKEQDFGFQASQHKGGDIETHEAHHLLFSEVERKYGKHARQKLVNHLLNQVDDNHVTDIAHHLSANFGYNTSHPNFKEEVLNHYRDVISHTPSRESYLENMHTHASPKVQQQVILAHKMGWRNMLQAAKQVTPDMFQAKVMPFRSKKMTASENTLYDLHKGINVKKD